MQREKRKEIRGALAKMWLGLKIPAAITPCWAARKLLIFKLVSATGAV
jgi:hypothetical protein